MCRSDPVIRGMIGASQEIFSFIADRSDAGAVVDAGSDP
jgi:hypothetical protein